MEMREGWCSGCGTVTGHGPQRRLVPVATKGAIEKWVWTDVTSCVVCRTDYWLSPDVVDLLCKGEGTPAPEGSNLAGPVYFSSSAL